MGCSPSSILHSNHKDSQREIHQRKESKISNRKVSSCISSVNDEEMREICNARKRFELKYRMLQNQLINSEKVRLQNIMLFAIKGKILFIFPKEDVTLENLEKAAKRMDFNMINHIKTFDQYHQHLLDIILIDGRHLQRNLSQIIDFVKNLRNNSINQFTTIGILLKKSAYEKDENVIKSLLEAGINKCIVDTTNSNTCFNELLQLKDYDIKLQAQLRINFSLLMALENVHDIIHITDDLYKIKYVNKNGESILGYKIEEVNEKNFLDQIPVQDHVSLVTKFLEKCPEWDGLISLKRKGQESILTKCKAFVVPFFNKLQNYVFVHDNVFIDNKVRGSLHSFDSKSINERRISAARLHSLPFEAPITKIITLIMSVQEQTTSQISNQLDKVIDMLRSSELYLPQLKEKQKFNCDDPITSDLIGALLLKSSSNQNFSSRRSSNESVISRSQQIRLHTSKLIGPIQMRELLDCSLNWDFDIFKFEDVTNKKPLTNLGMNILLHFDILNILNIDEKTLQNWLTVIEGKYHATNTYHNSTHAADVLQATAIFLLKLRKKDFILDALDETACLLAAICHDLDHPGRSNAFLCNSSHYLSVLYNDISVLENHHAALMFKITQADDLVNIFKNLDRDQYKILRKDIIDMILATEMTKHFEHLAKFVNVFSTKPVDELSINDYSLSSFAENIVLIKRMLIKCADVSNPARNLKYSIEWAKRIAEEYFSQTDEEKHRNLPIVMPMFDRSTCSIPKSQIGFIEYIVMDMFEAWNAFIEMNTLMSNIKQNYAFWKEYDERDISSLNDIKRLQHNLASILRKQSSTSED